MRRTAEGGAAPAERKEGAARLRARLEVRRRLLRASAMSLLCVRGECAAGRTRGSHACPDTSGSVPEALLPNFAPRTCPGATVLTVTSRRGAGSPLLQWTVICPFWQPGDSVSSGSPDAIKPGQGSAESGFLRPPVVGAGL